MAKIQKKPVIAETIVKMKKDGEETDRMEQIVPEFDHLNEEDKTIELEIGLGFTKNLGNYNSARMEVKIRKTTTEKLLEESFRNTKAWLESKLSEEISAIDSSQIQTTSSLFDE